MMIEKRPGSLPALLLSTSSDGKFQFKEARFGGVAGQDLISAS